MHKDKPYKKVQCCCGCNEILTIYLEENGYGELDLLFDGNFRSVNL